MQLNLPVSLLFAISSLCGSSSALPFLNSREAPVESLAARTTYSVIPIDGSGGHGGNSDSTQTVVETVVTTSTPKTTTVVTTPTPKTTTVVDSPPPVTDTVVVTAAPTTVSTTISVIDIQPTTDVITTTVTDEDDAPSPTSTSSSITTSSANTSSTATSSLSSCDIHILNSHVDDHHEVDGYNDDFGDPHFHHHADNPDNIHDIVYRNLQLLNFNHYNVFGCLEHHDLRTSVYTIILFFGERYFHNQHDNIASDTYRNIDFVRRWFLAYYLPSLDWYYG
ncbi:Uu.00g043400.m01.CDS01 [Anthostomella pinea]|uniref:Uu.00g043400.m01.CDS01 n=1 Tax=Anthostomella pinea TaxID=933095 RepID=A0AAI8VB96_9PEZI|nr:Uu.00g043400.m01.CDS01 [Anthostomella pinea]